MRLILTGAAAGVLLGAMLSPAHADCTCRAQGGVEAIVGQTVCLDTAKGPQLARCDQVLNNTSWKFLDVPCPFARLQRAPDERMLSLALPVVPLAEH